jgi:hypothetical protein
MHIVEVRRGGDDLVIPMNQMRNWLDSKRIEPAAFRLSLIPGGTVFLVEFRAVGEAVGFARAFWGKVITERDGHPLVA